MAFLPRDEILPDGAVVVRGGLLASFDDVIESAQDNFQETRAQSGGDVALYGISVCSLPDLTADEILHAIPEEHRLPHSKFRQTTVGPLRELGYDVVPSGWFGHATLKFSDLPTEDDWARLQGAFGEPEPNPVRKAR